MELKKELMKRDKKLLILTSRLPYPPIGGDKLKNYWLLKILSKYFKVHLVSIAEEEVPEAFYYWSKELGITCKIFRKPKTKFYFNALKSLYNKNPIQVNYYYFKDIQTYIDLIYKEFDILFAGLIRTAKYILHHKEKPKILEMTDSIALNYLYSKEKTYSKFWKYVYQLETKRLLKFEKLCIEKFDKILLVNKSEAEYYNDPEKVIWLPNGVNEDLLSYSKTDNRWKNSIVFFGKMNYQPNIDAVIWFVKNVLPHLNNSLKFVVVGAYPPTMLKKLEKKYKNLKILGFMRDPYLILKSGLCVVAPMQTGGGIQNKILESMALGTINIVSSRAASAIIGAKHSVHFFIADDPKEIIELISDIYKNPRKYKYMKQEAKNFIRKNFTWSLYEEKLLKIIDNVLHKWGDK